MKIMAWKNIDVECEVDIGIDDILSTFADHIDDSSPTFWRQATSALDCMTRILSRIKDDTIAVMPEHVRNAMHERLSEQAARWGSPGINKVKCEVDDE